MDEEISPTPPKPAPRPPPSVFDVIGKNEVVIEECQKTIRVFENWNEYVRSEHEKNEHLYLREIRMNWCDPVPPEERENTKKIDPLPIALDQLNYDFKYHDTPFPPADIVKAHTMKTIPYYRNKQNTTQPDPNIEVNQVRFTGPGAVSPRVNEIPNEISRSPRHFTPRAELKRNIMLRRRAFQTAQSARADRPITVPRELRMKGYRPRPKTARFTSTSAILDHETTKKKIEKLQKQLNESMEKAVVKVTKMNQRMAKKIASMNLEREYRY